MTHPKWNRFWTMHVVYPFWKVAFKHFSHTKTSHRRCCCDWPIVIRKFKEMFLSFFKEKKKRKKEWCITLVVHYHYTLWGSEWSRHSIKVSNCFVKSNVKVPFSQCCFESFETFIIQSLEFSKSNFLPSAKAGGVIHPTVQDKAGWYLETTDNYSCGGAGELSLHLRGCLLRRGDEATQTQCTKNLIKL